MTSAIPCPVCKADTHDGLLCKECTRRLRRNLDRLPGLLADLTDTYTRQTQIGSSNGRPSTTQALPFDGRGSKVRLEVGLTLAKIVENLAFSTDLDVKDLAINPRAHARFLQQHLAQVRRNDTRGYVADAVWDCVQKIRRAVDLPRPRIRFGQCPICSAEVFGPAEDMTVLCDRCTRAGIETRVVQQDWTDAFWQNAPDALVSRRDALEALAIYNLPTNPRTFASWVERGQLVRTPSPSEPDRVLYRFGDVLDLAKANPRHPGRPAKTRRGGEKVAESG